MESHQKQSSKDTRLVSVPSIRNPESKHQRTKDISSLFLAPAFRTQGIEEERFVYDTLNYSLQDDKYDKQNLGTSDSGYPVRMCEGSYFIFNQSKDMTKATQHGHLYWENESVPSCYMTTNRPSKKTNLLKRFSDGIARRKKKNVYQL
ncbi:uncharacterized protein LOC133172237 [Saccostrea echinata]|uniref:uncharacterized protein LOC133172237 n=1 Tax=Saccostrea echinata TaxID=191078 RepID=UPI002A833D21|nr:uncharacterized protein LOC133172237 [Saccostrea echinata]